MNVKYYTNQSGMLRLLHEPGNGTKYEAVATRVPFEDSKGQYLIFFPLLGAAYYFNEGSYVSLSYVQEKLGCNGTVAEVDVHEMCKMIAKIVSGTHNAETDATGYLPTLRIAR